MYAARHVDTRPVQPERDADPTALLPPPGQLPKPRWAGVRIWRFTGMRRVRKTEGSRLVVKNSNKTMLAAPAPAHDARVSG